MEITEETLENLRQIRDLAKEFMDVISEEYHDTIKEIKRAVIAGIISTEVSKKLLELDEDLAEQEEE